MRRWKSTLLITGILMGFAAIPAYAAGWQWIDGNNDGVSECYYIDDEGKMLTGTTTPDGFTVNEQGAWVENGVVKTKEEKQIVSAYSSLNKRSMKTSQMDEFQYYIFSPENATENMPLIVYLHGHGLGDNIDDLKNEKYFAALREGGKRGSSAYILVPYLPPELDHGWKGMWPGIEPSIMELIESVADTYKIDCNKISIIGASMGADAATQIVSSHPDTFSCMAGVVPFHYQCPIAKWEDNWGEQLKTVPVWLFVEDHEIALNMAESAVNAINAAGGQAWLDIQHGANHGDATKRVASCMNSGQYEIYDWLISVSK